MPAMKLDGAGEQKMKTLQEALHTLATIHSLVERGGIEVKAGKPMGTIPHAIKRMASPLQGQLKGQFGMIADQVAAFILSSTRSGGGDQAKLRGMRENVAQIRTAIELAANKVKDQHAVAIETADD
jgi:hypothetical protein